MKKNGSAAKGFGKVRYAPAPDYTTCPACGHEIELWSGEYLTACLYCGHRLFRRELTIH